MSVNLVKSTGFSDKEFLVISYLKIHSKGVTFTKIKNDVKVSAPWLSEILKRLIKQNVLTYDSLEKKYRFRSGLGYIDRKDDSEILNAKIISRSITDAIEIVKMKPSPEKLELARLYNLYYIQFMIDIILRAIMKKSDQPEDRIAAIQNVTINHLPILIQSVSEFWAHTPDCIKIHMELVEVLCDELDVTESKYEDKIGPLVYQKR